MSEAENKDFAQDALKQVAFRLGVYEHYKGGRYVAYGVSVQEDSLLFLVHYYSLEKKLRWTRLLSNFVEYVSTPGGTRRRFNLLRSASVNELLIASGLRDVAEGLQHLARAENFVTNIFIEDLDEL